VLTLCNKSLIELPRSILPLRNSINRFKQAVFGSSDLSIENFQQTIMAGKRYLLRLLLPIEFQGAILPRT
jgi:hypothetical protein